MSDWLWLVLTAALLLVLFFTFGGKILRPKQANQAPAGNAKSGGERSASEPDLPRIGYEEDADVEATRVGDSVRPLYQANAAPIVYDNDAANDEPTHSRALILVTATAQTDRGIRRKRNEDNLLVDEPHSLYVVADGMGGYRGGELASKLAVETISKAFEESSFHGPPHAGLPRRASELVRAIQMANTAILAVADKDRALQGMGTTVCAARFSPNKQRVYVGHVGDSRVYRLRNGALKQMTSDHTMKDYGVKGAESSHLSRAVGVWPVVPIDILLAKPLPDDVYLLCSDGLTKMLKDDAIFAVLSEESNPALAVDRLVEKANANGGLDNVTVILVKVVAPGSERLPSARKIPISS